MAPRWVKLGGLFVAASSLLLPCAKAQPRSNDLDPSNQGWNGLSQWVALAREMNLPVEVSREPRLSELTSRDGLILVDPDDGLPVRELVQFLQSGGRVTLLYDGGGSADLLRAFRVVLAEAQSGGLSGSASSSAIVERGGHTFNVALPEGGHPLSLDVPWLLTNRPYAMFHGQLQPIFFLGPPSSGNGPRQALVYAGAVSSGRLVIVSDASVLINSALSLGPHRQFGQNLLRYSLPDGGRVLLVPPSGHLRGGLFSLGPRQSLTRLARDLNGHGLPPWAALGLLVVGLAISVGVFLRRLRFDNPYAKTDFVGQDPYLVGPRGAVAFYDQNQDARSELLLEYSKGIEIQLSALASRLGGRLTPPLRRELGDWNTEYRRLFRNSYRRKMSDEAMTAWVSKSESLLREAQTLAALNTALSETVEPESHKALR